MRFNTIVNTKDTIECKEKRNNHIEHLDMTDTLV